MSHRLWYPQLDAYDAIRRMVSLLCHWDSEAAPSTERLSIADFYFANPPLLHKSQMSREARTRLNSLGINKPDKEFLNYPSAPLLFKKMEPVQLQAVRTLTGKGLIDLERIDAGEVVLTVRGQALSKKEFLPLLSQFEAELAEFLGNMFAPKNQIDLAELRRKTGLRRIAA